MGIKKETIEHYIEDNQEFLLLSMASKYYEISYHYLCNHNLDQYTKYLEQGVAPEQSKIKSFQDTFKHAEDLYTIKYKKIYGDKK